MKTLAQFSAELRQLAERRGLTPLTAAEREEIRTAVRANMGKVSPEAMALVCSPEVIAEMEAAMKTGL